MYHLQLIYYEEWQPVTGPVTTVVSNSAHPILQTQFIMLTGAISSVYREELAGQRSVAQMPGLFHILLDYPITHKESVVRESPLVSKQAEKTQK